MKEPKWYIAAVVIEIRVAGDPRNVVHTNYYLIQAASAEEAINRAEALGRQEERQWQNSERAEVYSRFCGIHDVQQVHDDFEDGVEFYYEEEISVSQADIDRKVRTRQALLADLRMEWPDWPRSMLENRPNYLDADVVKEMVGVFGKKRL